MNTVYSCWQWLIKRKLHHETWIIFTAPISIFRLSVLNHENIYIYHALKLGQKLDTQAWRKEPDAGKAGADRLKKSVQIGKLVRGSEASICGDSCIKTSEIQKRKRKKMQPLPETCAQGGLCESAVSKITVSALGFSEMLRQHSGCTSKFQRGGFKTTFTTARRLNKIQSANENENVRVRAADRSDDHRQARIKHKHFIQNFHKPNFGCCNFVNWNRLLQSIRGL